MDAFTIAFRIPNLLRDLFAEGALSAALVPTIVWTREKEGDVRAQIVAARLFRVLLVIVGAVSIVGVLFTPELVRLYAPTFGDRGPELLDLAHLLTRVLYPFFPAVALAAAFMAVLNAHRVYFVPSFASAVFNLVSIVVGVTCALLFRAWAWEPILGMAIGVVCGGMAQAAFQWPSLRRLGYSWRGPVSSSKELAWKDPALRRIGFLMIPGALGMAATQINILVSSILATSLGEGAVSWLSYSFRFLQFPIGLLGVSMAQAFLAPFSAAVARQEWHSAQTELRRASRLVLLINLPAALGLYFGAESIMELVFGYGRFGPRDVHMSGSLLAAYSYGLIGYSLVKLFVPLFYALGKTAVPLVSSGVSVLLYIGVAPELTRRWGVIALPAMTSVTAWLNALFLWIFLAVSLHKKNAAEGRSLLKNTLNYRFYIGLLFSLILSVVALHFCSNWMHEVVFVDYVQSKKWQSLIWILSAGVLIPSVFFGLLTIFGVDEVTQVLAYTKGRLRRKRASTGG